MGKRVSKEISGPPIEEPRRGKRIRRECSMRCCTSPRSRLLSQRPVFSWYEEDMWIEIAKYLGGTSLLNLALTNHWFHNLIMKEECVWKYACLRDLQVPDPGPINFKWLDIYGSVFDGTHSYTYRQPEKHIDWMRIGAFFFHSSFGFLTERLSLPQRIVLGESTEKMLQTTSSCVVDKIKRGIWIADLQLVRCPVCNLKTCEGTMQTLDARHVELFLREEYQDGTWEYEELGSHEIRKHVEGATGGIFDIRHIKDRSTAVVFNKKIWGGKPDDWQPKTRVGYHAVAVSTNLQQNEGLCVKYHVMRSGSGQVVSIRISQQLL